MRTLLLLLLFPITLFAQNGYTCFNLSSPGSNWKFLGPFNLESETANQHFGLVQCIEVNPNNNQEIWVGSPTGGLFHTTDRGEHWKCLTDASDLPILGVNDIHVNYNTSPYTLIIATGSENTWYDGANFGVMKSVDGGESWKKNMKSSNGSYFMPPIYQILEVGNILYARASNEVFKSDNQGDSWSVFLSQKQPMGPGLLKNYKIRSMVFDNKRNQFFITTNKGSAGGRPIEGQLFSYNTKTLKINNLTRLLKEKYQSPKAGNQILSLQINKLNDDSYVLVHNSSQDLEIVLYDFDASSNTITDFNVPNQGRLAVDISWFHGLANAGENTRYLAGTTLFKNSSKGGDYENLYPYSFGDNNVPHADIRSMLITKVGNDGKGDHIYLGTDGGLSFSDNGGISWTNLNGTVLQLTQFYGLGSSPFSGIISAGSQDNSIFSYDPKLNKWFYSVRGDGYDVEYNKRIKGSAIGQYNARSSAFTYNDYIPFTKATYLRPSENSNNRKSLKTTKDGSYYFADQRLNVRKVGEKKWKTYPTPLSHHVQAFDVCESNTDVIYMSGKWDQLIKSTDGGQSWEKLNVVTNLGINFKGRIQSVCINPDNEDEVYLGLGYLGEYINPCKPSMRVLRSKDGGRTWTDYSFGLPVFPVNDLVFDERSTGGIFAATYQGVYYKKNSNSSWLLFSDGLPASLISELDINYCRGKITASTYGRGLWESDLPAISNKKKMIIRNDKVLSAQEGEALFMTHDIYIKKKGSLTIDCPVHMAKGTGIYLKKQSQLKATSKGKLLNDCGEEWKGIVEQ